MTDTTTHTVTGRALWKSSPRHLSYDVLLHDSEAFACAIVDNLATHEFSLLTGDAFGGEKKKTYDAHRKALYAYLDAHDVDPELRKLIDAMEDQVYDFTAETFDQGMDFGKVVEAFRTGLLSLPGPLINSRSAATDIDNVNGATAIQSPRFLSCDA